MMDIREFQDHLSAQENILQSTRALHYVLQALFLAVAFTLVAIGFGIHFSSYGPSWLKTLMVVIVILLSIPIVKSGMDLLYDYSGNIFRRGLIVDTVQHLRLLRRKNRLDDLLSQLIENVGDDVLFCLIKVLERVGRLYSDMDGKNKDLDELCKDIEENLDSAYAYVETLALKDMRLLIYLCFFNAIQDSKYLNQRDLDNLSSKSQREITATRNGHLCLFKRVWVIETVLISALASLVLSTCFSG